MARSRPSAGGAKNRRRKDSLYRSKMPISNQREPTSTELLAEATALLHSGDPESAQPLALRALTRPNPSPPYTAYTGYIGRSNGNTPASLPALNTLAEIELELGDAEGALCFYLQAVDQDPLGEIPEEEGGGADKFLWLAQLSREGGEDSVLWFERGIAVLKRDIARMEETGAENEAIEEKKRKMVGALCGIVEVYMTDLSYAPFFHPLSSNPDS